MRDFQCHIKLTDFFSLYSWMTECDNTTTLMFWDGWKSSELLKIYMLHYNHEASYLTGYKKYPVSDAVMLKARTNWWNTWQVSRIQRVSHLSQLFKRDNEWERLNLLTQVSLFNYLEESYFKIEICKLFWWKFFEKMFCTPYILSAKIVETKKKHIQRWSAKISFLTVLGKICGAARSSE